MSGAIEIETALRARLFAVAPGAAITAALVKNEGQAFTPPASGFWYQPFFLPGEPYAAGIGEAAANRHAGIFQVDVYGPANKGTKPTNDEAERVRSCFKRDIALTASGVVVRVVKSWTYRPESQGDPAWFRHIVRVQWTADVEN